MSADGADQTPVVPSIRAASRPLTDEETARGRKIVILFSMTTMLVITAQNPNFLMLLILRLWPDAGDNVLSCVFSVLFLPAVLGPLFSPVVDARGKKIIIIPFYCVCVAILCVMVAAPSLAGSIGGRGAALTVIAALSVYVVCRNLGLPGWFPLVNDNVPADLRGRYFGTLRTCWQSVNVGVMLLVAWFMGRDPDVWRFQVVLGLAVVGSIGRIVELLYIPEAPVETSSTSEESFRRRLVAPLRNPVFVNFLFFAGMTSFAHGSVGPYALLVMKSTLGAGEDFILFTNVLVAASAVLSLYLFGRFVDRFGSRPLFMMLLPPMAATNLLWLLADADSPWWPWIVGAYFFLYGAGFAGYGVALTNMMLSSAGTRRRAAHMNLVLMVQSVVIGVAPHVGTQLVSLFDGPVTHWGPFILDGPRSLLAVRGAMLLAPLLLLRRMSRRHGGRIRAAVSDMGEALFRTALFFRR